MEVQGIFDMHCHIVPFVDDGAEDMKEALAMLKEEYLQGVRGIIVTPHFRLGMFETSFEEVKKQAREILYAKITEEDILAGRLVNRESKLKCIVAKLGEYEGDNRFPEEPAQ